MAGRIRKMNARETRLARLGDLVHEERISRGMSFNAACDAARALRPEDAHGPGISKSTWENVERGRNVRHTAWADIERVFRWPGGSIRRYVDDDGGEPAPEVVIEEQETETGRTFIARVGPPLTEAEDAILKDVLDALRKRNI